jgi:hypothetical protein
MLRVEMGNFAYFESSIELRRLRLEHEKRQKIISQKLHIMEECVIHMPISIGLYKNSPLKGKFDELIQYAVEGGLINKWYDDAKQSFDASVEEPPLEALMDFKKFFGAVVALLCGYALSLIAFIAELVHWHFFIKRHPKYDKYYRRIVDDTEMEKIRIKNKQRAHIS